MAEKDTLQVTEVHKYVVNSGQPNEAEYDYVSQAPWRGAHDKSYYLVRRAGKCGLIDEHGELVLPLIYSRLCDFFIDDKNQRDFICDDDGGSLSLVLVGNPEVHTKKYSYIHPIRNKAGDLFFGAKDFFGEESLLRLGDQGNRFVVLVEDSYSMIRLDRRYTILNVRTKEGGYDSTYRIINDRGLTVYCASEKEHHCRIAPLENTENVFIVSHSDADAILPGGIVTKELTKELIAIVPQDNGWDKVLTASIPSELFFKDHKSDLWAAFLVRDTGFYDQIIWKHESK